MNVLTRFIAALCCLAGLPLAANSATYPERPIRLVLPFPVGSATDGMARYIADALHKGLGQPVIVENQAGADGTIAAQAVKRAAPDGYTLMVSTNSAHGVNPALYDRLPYDPQKDFAPVGGLMRIPQLMGVRKDFPADDLAGFLSHARAAAKPLSYGSGNTSSRVAAELLKSAARIPMIDVSYRGIPQALQDLVAGQIDVVFVDPFAALPFLNGGQIKTLALTDTARLPLLPEVQTMAEAGYKEVEVVSWAAVFAPAGTAPVIVERLNREINLVLERPEAVAFLHKMGATPLPTTPKELRRFVAAEIVRWGKLVALAGIPKK
jgi:tripartite-type tricarboxylate transporter receptor subunit TctC